MELSIEEIKKNNELFANGMTFMILWKTWFLKVLRKWGYPSDYINSYTTEIEKFINNYTKEVKNHLRNLK